MCGPLIVEIENNHDNHETLVISIKINRASEFQIVPSLFHTHPKQNPYTYTLHTNTHTYTYHTHTNTHAHTQERTHDSLLLHAQPIRILAFNCLTSYKHEA